MAGDWIKVERATLRKAEVSKIADLLGIHIMHALGACVGFWMWCDEQMADGHAVGVTPKRIDAWLETEGMANALVKVGWLVIKGDTVRVPNFDRHLGKSAKTRAINAKRQDRKREKVSRSQRDNSVTREEKRRVEKNHHHHDDGGSKDPFKNEIPSPGLLEHIKGYTQPIITEAWKIAQRFARINPQARSLKTAASIVQRFAGCISSHGAQGASKLQAYYSLDDPEQWQREVTAGSRLAIGAPPLEVCQHLFPRAPATKTPGSSQRLTNGTDLRLAAQQRGRQLLADGTSQAEMMATLLEEYDDAARLAAKLEGWRVPK